MDFMPLRLNSSSLTCSICALAAIILQLVAMECQKLHMVDSPILFFKEVEPLLTSVEAIWELSHLMSLVCCKLPYLCLLLNDYIVYKFSVINGSI